MECRVKAAAPAEVIEPLLDLLAEADSLPLLISGGSMSPFLIHRRDTVYLSRVDGPLKKGDIALYRRDSGAYVLHRVYKAEGGVYTMLGDAQQYPEAGIRPDQLCAVVYAVCRKGRLLQRGDLRWEFFARVWIRAVPLRPAMQNLYAACRRLFSGKNKR